MWTVTRQHQFPDGAHVVEVSQGGIDYCNADALTPRYSGEFSTFANPVEAVQTAIEIARQWRKDSRKRIAIAVGNTHGMTLPFSPDTQAHAIAWAKQVWESLPKCSCGEPLPAKRERWHADDWSGEEFCSEPCATREAEYQAEQAADTDEQDGD